MSTGLRRDAVLNPARGLFEINGFGATSMDDIVEAAGMSAGGVYGS
ncbi:MAG: helix-turn-helix domain-containing protein [Acidimicrobiales bacterium]